MSIAADPTTRHVGLRAQARTRATRRQLGTAGAQWAAGVGNLVFALVAARALAPAQFAELGAFLSAYVLLHLPAAGIGAGAALSPASAAHQRRALLRAGTALGAALGVATPWLAPLFALSPVTVLALAAAAPGAALLGLERGRRLGTDGHGHVAAGLVTEPLVRLLLGIAAASVVGASGAAIAVTLAGYGSLAVTRGRGPVRSMTGAVTDRPGRVATAGAFALFAVLQQQDLLVAKLRLGGELAGAFAMVSTAAGAVAFATATVPLVLLGQADRSRPDERLALLLTAGTGAVATAVAVLAGPQLLHALFGPGVDPAAHTFAPYVAAMGLLGVGRLLAAQRCADGGHRTVLAAAGVAVAVHLALLGALGSTPTGIVVATFTATATASGLLVLPVHRSRSGGADLVARVRLAARQPDVVALVALVAAAVVVRLISFRGLWVDEAITVSQVRMGFGAMLEHLRATDVHPPLHHALIWVTVRVAGDAEWVLRLPSVVAGALLVPAAHGLGRKLYDRRTGLIAALLVSVAPFLVWYSQEARMYSLFVLLTTLSLWALVRALRTDGWRPWAAWSAATAAMLWTQWFGLVPLAVMAILVVATAVARWRAGDRPWRLVGRAAAAGAALVVLVLPLLPFALDQLGAYAARTGGGTAAPGQAGAAASAMTEDLSIYAVAANALWAVLGYHSDEAMTRLAALWPLLLLLGLGALGRGRSRSTSWLLLAIAAPTLVFLAAGVAKRDLFELRYFAFVVPLVLLLVARTVTRVFRTPRTQATAAVAAGLLLVGALVDQQLNGANPRHYDFESALAHVAAEAEPGDVILYGPDYLADVVDYYAPDLDARPIGSGADVSDAGTAWVVATTRVMDEAAASARLGAALATLEQDGRRPVARVDVPNVSVWELSR